MKASSGEVKIHTILRAHGVPFCEEYEFDDLLSTSGRKLRFDFCVFGDDCKINYLIEFQGKQHYIPISHFGGETGLRRQRYNDSLKRKYCLEHGYNLVTIPYWDEPKLSYDYIRQKAGF